MKEKENKINRQTLPLAELQKCHGGFILPFLIARGIYRTVQALEDIVEWLTTDHKE